MKRSYLILPLLSLLLQACSYVAISAPRTKNLLVANAALHLGHLQKEEIRRIYLKQRRFVGDIKLLPINLPPRSSLRKSFEKNVLGMSRERLRRYWTIEHYKGVRPPLVVPSPKSVVVYVEKVEGAIGYIKRSQLPKDANVTILYEWSD